MDNRPSEPVFVPIVKTAAQLEADALLLRNAPDEDQMLREYLAKHANDARHSHAQPQATQVCGKVAQVVQNYATGCRSWRAPIMTMMDRVRKAHADLVRRYS